MTAVSVVGYREVKDQKGDPLYVVFVVSKDPVPGIVGYSVSECFVRDNYLHDRGLTKNDLLGADARLYVNKDGNRWRQVLLFI